MQDIIQFIIHHWFLSGLFIILVILLFVEEAKAKGILGQINPQEAVLLINREQAIVIDIRNREAFKQGHIVGAVNIPEEDIEKSLSKIEKYQNRRIILVCTTGQKAGGVAVKLQKHKIERVQVLSGGINAWKNAALPLI